jgi:nicotinamide mononucleotide adenylyltransferase
MERQRMLWRRMLCADEGQVLSVLRRVDRQQFNTGETVMFKSGTPERNVVYAWEGEVAGLKADNARLRAALNAYRQAQRWATGTEEHRLALQAADEANPVPPAYQQGVPPK